MKHTCKYYVCYSKLDSVEGVLSQYQICCLDISIIFDKSRIDDVMQDIDDGCIMVKFLIGFLLPDRALHNIDIDDW